MATPNVGILTNAGKNLIDQVNAGQTKITFSKIVFSSMNNNQLTDDQIKALTTVVPQEIVVNNPKVTLDNNTGETRIRATGNNEALTDGVYVKTYAVYAKDDSGNEILYGLTVSPNPNYLPEYDGVTPQAVTYSYKLNISNTSNITFTNSNDVYVSDTDLAEALQPYAKTVDVNQQLDKKVNVADMRKPANDVAGIDEVSTLQTQVDNSAVGTNLLINSNFSSGLDHWTTNAGTNSDCKAVVTTDSDGDTCVHITGTGNVCGLWCSSVPFNQNQITTGSVLAKGIGTLDLAGLEDRASSNFGTISTESYSRVGTTGQPSSTTNNFTVYFNAVNGVIDIYIKFAKLELGSHATDWCPNPEDKADDSKVVHTADMRKPASDVAGIEEVNAKQDKIGYTPADDSKVVHTADMRKPASDVVGIEDVPQAIVKPALASGVDLNTVLTPGVYPFSAASFTNYIDTGTYWGYLVVTSEGNIVTQTAYATGFEQPLYRKFSGSPASWGPWVRMANDYSVAHLSGANNFDTVPTVNNNPLLLASSLPPDLARLGQDQEYTGKNTFDTAPIDKTTGNPYITKDGVPSDVARTGQAQTFTAAQTFSIAPVINDASTSKGDNQAATMADLKSVKESAWRELDLSGTSGIYQGKVLIKIDQANKYIYFIMNAQVTLKGYTKGTKIIDLSSVVTGLSSVHGYLQGWINDLENPFNIVGSTMVASGSSIELGNDYNRSDSDGVSRIATESDPGKQYCYAIYTGLVNN